MKKTWQSFLLSTFLLLGCAPGGSLDPEEHKLCQKLSFDETLCSLVKDETRHNLEQLPKVSEYGEIVAGKSDGICSPVKDEQEGIAIVLKHKEHFLSKGYLLFVFEGNDYQSYLALLKGTDDMDILRFRKTNGLNYDLETKDIISKISSWKKKNDLQIVGAGMDWLQFRFKTMPEDMDQFVKDAYTFCPDIVDQGTGDLKTLKAEALKMQGMFFWWD